MTIRNIWAVGRNYRDHVSEMNAPTPSVPVVFLKAGSSATVFSNEIVLPHWTEEVHHEVELALKLGPSLQVIEGAVALDLTERKLQAEAKKRGGPWTLAKSFDGACPVSASFTLRHVSEAADFRIRLWVNDELRQEGRTRDMIFNCQYLLEYVQTYFPICAGDLILTGTPAGVGPLRDGDRVKAEIEGQITHIWKVIKATNTRGGFAAHADKDEDSGDEH
ncbi:MAG: FAA hydrolase family protein [Bdellovibrio sp.]|nr:MAG: FAA hydrolase family protein [Bdellovibrio sp.]